MNRFSTSLKRLAGTAGVALFGLLCGPGTARAQQAQNVTVSEVTENGGPFWDDLSLFNAAFAAEGRTLISEPFKVNGKSRYFVHGLQAFDTVAVSAPGHERKLVNIGRNSVIDDGCMAFLALRSGAYPMAWLGPGLSSAGPKLRAARKNKAATDSA